MTDTKVVPLEPTGQMIDAAASYEFTQAGGNASYVGIYKAMLSAAPAHPSQQREGLLTKPAQVGNGIFEVGVPERLVIERAQREYEYQQTPEKEAERMAKLKRFQEAAAALTPPAPQEGETHQFDFDFESYVGKLSWSDEATETEKALVVGNLRSLWAVLREKHNAYVLHARATIEQYERELNAALNATPQADSVHLTSPHHTANRDQESVDTLLSELDALRERATKGELRLSKSGYSIRTGWGDEKVMLAAAPRAVIDVNANTADVNQWIDNAEFWCALANAYPKLRALAK